MKTYNKLLLLFIFLLFCEGLQAQSKPSWIWYPGDFEVWLGNKMQSRRTERGTFLPPFWKFDSHYVLIDFHKDFDLQEAEEAELYVEGQYNVKIDGKAIFGYPNRLSIPAGKHKVSLKVFSQDKVPAIFVKGKKVVSDSTWLVTYEDKEWIDQSGKASDQSGTTWLKAAQWNFDNAATPPSAYALPTVPQSPVKTEKLGKSLLVDFGRETFGFIRLHGLKGRGEVAIYYGESPEEALSIDHGETLDRLDVQFDQKKDTLTTLTKAFRYVNVQLAPGMTVDSVSMLYEYAPVKDRGSFHCSDEEINKIYDVAKYTFHLNTREFFIDGIKRDRWIWSGDAYQSFLMNYYLLYDSPTVTRTLLALRGKDPVTSHTNTIMDYTFYWFMGIQDYYLYTGDRSFVEQFYPRMKTLMDYCLSRTNKNGMLEGLAGDWVFIDWAEGLSKQGELSFEQLLFARSLETMATSAALINHQEDAVTYGEMAKKLKSAIMAKYWNKEKQALVHSSIDGKQTDNVTRYSNMFGIFFGYFNADQQQGVKKNVLLNDKVQKITTPYMRFYELEALCALGEQSYVLKEMKAYWGGMLKEGATSFWEEYDPSKKGAEHLSMYGRPFGKSLCHAWGASPLYLLGKYYLGIKPLSPAYETWEVVPELGGLKWMEGKVPTPAGEIELYCSTKEIRVKSPVGKGTLRFKSKSLPKVKGGGGLLNKGNGNYEITIIKGKDCVVKYN
ncbi:alpha-L-rhamnosidase-related protein [Pedobacter sp. AW31-3R]|uniref:alpha-L-rhamnosidase-related protein n=1 Tax=Pedobacter sp. AW31-3R TaxID=3445781 RepID=UPI003F9EE319